MGADYSFYEREMKQIIRDFMFHMMNNNENSDTITQKIITTANDGMKEAVEQMFAGIVKPE